MRNTDLTQRMRPTRRLVVALAVSLGIHSALLVWVEPLPRPPAGTPLMVRLDQEALLDRPSVSPRRPAPPPVAPPAASSAPAAPPLPIIDIARDSLRADAEDRRRQRQTSDTTTLAPSVMFDNLKDERFTPGAAAPLAELSTHTTASGLLVYRRVGRDGKISCMTLRPAHPNNEYDRGAIYLWSLDFDGKHARRGGC